MASISSILASSYSNSGRYSAKATPMITTSLEFSVNTITNVIDSNKKASSTYSAGSSQYSRIYNTTGLLLTPRDTMTQVKHSISVTPTSSSILQHYMSASHANITSTSPPPPATIPEYVKIMHDVHIVILISTLALSVIGNSLVVAVMYRRFEKVNVANFLIAHLAICDLIFALFTPLVLHAMLNNYKWKFGSTLCKTVRSAVQLGSNVAGGIIVVIAIDRYRGISDPLRPRWKKRHAAAACGVVWIISILTVTPSMLILDVHPVTEICYENWSVFSYPHSARLYSVYCLVFGFLVPVIVIAILYGKIIKFLQSPQVKFAQSSLTKEYLDRRRREDQRVTKLLSLVVIAFVICILPNKIVWVIIDFAGQNMSQQAARILNYIAVLPYPFHVAVNPIIYSIVDIKFRRNAKDLLLCRNTPRRSSFVSSQYATRNSVSMNTLNETLD